MKGFPKAMGPLFESRPLGSLLRPNPIKRLRATLKARRTKALYQEPTPKRAAADRRLYRLVLPLLKLHCKLWFGLRVTSEVADKSLLKGCILCINHVSLLDAPMVAIALWPEQVHFLTLPENGTAPVYGPLVAHLGSVFTGETLSETRFMFERAQEVLGAGDLLAIYPSGNLEPYHPGLLPFKTGAFRLAAMTKAPLVPVVLKQQTRFCINRLLGRPAFEVHIGQPVAVPHGRLSKGAVEVLEEQVRTAMAGALSGQDAPQIGGDEAQGTRKCQVDEA